jgi:hypothetical protein
MVTKQIKELEVTKAKIVALEKSIAKRLRKELASLHDKYGFSSLQEFISALKGSTRGAGRKAASKAKPAKSSGKKRAKRSVITDETRAAVKKQVEAGKTGSQIAKSLGISLPSVQNIKKALGLVKARA